MNIPYQIVNWEEVEKTEHKGEKGVSYWKTKQFDGLRVRVVEYSPGYIADHWCEKGHIIYCIEGEVTNERDCKIICVNGKSRFYKNGLSRSSNLIEN